VLPPRDPSVPPLRIPLRAPPGGRPRPSRPRRNRNLFWASAAFGLVTIPASIIAVRHITDGQPGRITFIVALWFATMNVIVYVAAILLFGLNKSRS
jgi:hypothetical protein